ncbi:Fatty acid desaturase [Aphelenchoides fujianensis]|nr:Fatty acid desaturase [Aphelenchoides fujianensis]
MTVNMVENMEDESLTLTELNADTQVDDLIADQYLAAELDEVIRLQNYAKSNKFKADIVWRNVAIFAALHVGALIGLYQLLFLARWPTVAWMVFCYLWSGLGITAGAHRLWAHRCYKARLPMKLFLWVGNCMAFQNDVVDWSRDHRCHHKWTDTDADPHNTNRGFFFSHMGWLLVRKHPKLKEFGAKLDLSDLSKDPLLAFQRKHYLLLVLLFCFLMPTVVPVFLWKEKALIALYVAGLFRYCAVLHATWFINSIAHMFGYKPYDVNITPTESVWTTVAALGEGGHNYHHTFPQDYRTSEMPYLFNFTRAFIDGCKWLGLAYDLQTVSKESIQRQKDKQVQLLKQKDL